MINFLLKNLKRGQKRFKLCKLELSLQSHVNFARSRLPVFSHTSITPDGRPPISSNYLKNTSYLFAVLRSWSRQLTSLSLILRSPAKTLIPELDDNSLKHIFNCLFLSSSRGLVLSRCEVNTLQGTPLITS